MYKLKYSFFWIQILTLISIYADSPYAPQTVETQTGGTEMSTYTYDNAGNRLTKNVAGNNVKNQFVQYGLIGKAVSIRQDKFTSSINHGPGGRRFLRSNNNGSKTLYLNGVDYVIDTDGTVTTKIHIHAKGYSPLAQINIDHNSGTNYTYFVQDNLGSPLVSVDDSGGIDNRNRYDAWGQMTAPTGVNTIPDNPTPAELKKLEKYRGYTGHELMAKFNLGQWNGRLFDYDSGLFLQADMFIQGSTMAAFNRYALGQHKNPNVTDASGWNFIFRVDPAGNFTNAERRSLNRLATGLRRYYSQDEIAGRLANETRSANRRMLENQLEFFRGNGYYNVNIAGPEITSGNVAVRTARSFVFFVSVSPDDILTLRSQRRTAGGVLVRQQLIDSLLANINRQFMHLHRNGVMDTLATLERPLFADLFADIENPGLSGSFWHNVRAGDRESYINVRNTTIFRTLHNSVSSGEAGLSNLGVAMEHISRSNQFHHDLFMVLGPIHGQGHPGIPHNDPDFLRTQHILGPNLYNAAYMRRLTDAALNEDRAAIYAPRR